MPADVRLLRLGTCRWNGVYLTVPGGVGPPGAEVGWEESMWSPKPGQTGMYPVKGARGGMGKEVAILATLATLTPRSLLDHPGGTPPPPGGHTPTP